MLFHGRGADEHDLFPLADVLDPQRRLVVVFPRGPLALPPGGAHWYQVMRIGFPDPGRSCPPRSSPASWLDANLAAHGVTPERTVLGGFSQGAVMSWTLGLGAGRPTPAGIMALSGFIPTVEGFELDFDRGPGSRSRSAMAEHDPVIGVEWGRDARDRMTGGRRPGAVSRDAADGPLDRPRVRARTDRLGRRPLCRE